MRHVDGPSMAMPEAVLVEGSARQTYSRPVVEYQRGRQVEGIVEQWARKAGLLGDPATDSIRRQLARATAKREAAVLDSDPQAVRDKVDRMVASVGLGKPPDPPEKPHLRYMPMAPKRRRGGRR